MNHCCSDSHHNHSPETMVKRICHSCKCEIGEAFAVPCRAEGCHKFFCQKCLTSRYKYSKAKAASLPSLNWRCPVCTRRCYCLDCIEAGLVVKKRKTVYKHDIYSTRKKRVRKKQRLKRDPQEESSSKHSICCRCGNERKESGATGGSCTYCVTPNENSPMTPIKQPEPPSLFTFGRALALKDYQDELFGLGLRANSPFSVRGFIMRPEAYEKMALVESLRIAFIPFAQHSSHSLN